nr:MAG TPA: TFIIB-TERMINAL DOMAIN, TFIIB, TRANSCRIPTION INITIATION [Bacteriophage sp.]
MYNQNPNYGFANPTFNTAQAPVGNYAPVTPTDPMTPADRELLKPQQKASFSLEIPPEKEAWAKCPHKDHTGFLTVADGQGWVRCTQCGERIPTTPYSDEEVQNAVRTMRHIWQQIKLFSITLPAEINTEFMMSLPIAEKSLDLYHLAFKNFNDVSQSMSRAQNVQPQQAVRPDAFTSFDNILNGNVQPAYANPWGAQANPNFYNMAANGGYYNAQTMNGQMPVQTMPQQGFGVVQQQNQAPFGYNAQPPMQGQMMPNQQQQVMGGQAFNPQAQVSPVQQLQNQQAMVANANPFNANASVGATVPGPAVAAPQKETITTDTISLG